MKSFRRYAVALIILALATDSFANVAEDAISTNAYKLNDQTFDTAMNFIAARDFNRAIPLLETAYSSGDSRASFLLGLLYKQGKYTEKDEERAERYLRASSEKLNADASLVLAEIYSRRNPPDEENIKRLVLIAEKAGRLQAQIDLGFMRTGMLPSKAVNFRRMGDYDWSENFIDLLIPVRLPDGTVQKPNLLQEGYAVARGRCGACHFTGFMGPKLSDRTQWEKRQIDVVQMSQRVFDGYKKCPPEKNSHNPLSLEKIKAAIYFMIWTAFK